jgi:hypothetical protein
VATGWGVPSVAWGVKCPPGFAVGAGGGGDHRGRVGVEHAHQRQFTHTFRTLSDTAKPQCLCGLFAVRFTEELSPGDGFSITW